MRHFKVISLSVSGRKNKIHRLNDVVPETAFLEGHADKLEREGHLRLDHVDDVEAKLHPALPEVTDPVIVSLDETRNADNDTEQEVAETLPLADTGSQEGDKESDQDKSASETTQSGGVDETGEVKEEEAKVGAEGIEAVTRKSLMADLKGAGIEFSKNATKEELYTLWKDAKK